MRKAALLIAAVSLVACAKSESAKTDSAAPMAAAPPAATVVTAADMAGTVNGKAMPQNSDSVLFTFTCTGTATSTVSKCVTSASPKDTTDYTYALTGADSVMLTSAAYAPPKSPKLVDHVVGHLSGNKWTGTTVTVLASKPDSVVSRGRWEGTKAP